MTGGLPPLGAPAGTPGAGGPGGGRVLDFRRRSVPPRRKRRSLFALLLRPLAAALILVGFPVGVGAWVLNAPRFGLREVVVEGAGGRVSEGSVRRSLAPLRRANLVRLSLAETEKIVRENPWVDSVELEKELPDRLRVKLSERRPVALLVRDGALVYADAEGQPIAPVGSPEEAEKAREDGLVLVTFLHAPHHGPAGAAGISGIGSALEVAGELGRVQPDWAAALSRIEVLGEEDFRLHSEALPFPLLVKRGEVGPKAGRLKELLPQLRSRYQRIEAVDLRFSRRIVVQPASSVPAGSGA